MRILLYSMNFWPEETGIGKYSGEMAAWLAAQGHQVRVICSAPYYPQWKIRDGYSGWSYKRESWSGVDIRRCPAWIPARPGGLTRVLYLLFFALTSLPVALASVLWRPQVVWAVEPPLSCAPAAWLTARLAGARCWLHVQDFEVDAALQLGLLKLPLLRQLLVWGEAFWLRRFDVRSTISPKMIERLAEKTGSSRSNILFPNWVDVQAITPLSAPSSFRIELGIPDHQRVALYSGNMGRKQGLEVVIDASRALADRPDILFVLCGAGAAQAELQERANGLSNIRWIPLQPFERLNDLLGLADVHLLPQRADAADLVMPSKLTGMLSSGRPVLATALPGTQVYELVQQVGVNVPPEDPRTLAESLVGMLDDPQALADWGRTARTIAEQTLSIDAILGQFESDLQSLVQLRP